MIDVPPNAESYAEYFSSCCKFLGENEWIFNFPVTEIFVRDAPSFIPKSWVQALSNLSEEELNQFPVYLVKENWPESLRAFCSWSQKLKLTPSVFNPTKKLELPELIKSGVTPKKIHEVDYLVPFIHALCSQHNIHQILDIGSGLGYLDLFLCLQYSYKILGVEFDKKLVEASKQRFEKLKAALPLDHSGDIKYIEISVSPESINNLRYQVMSHFSRSSNETKGSNSFSAEKTPETKLFAKKSDKSALCNLEEDFAEKVSVFDSAENDSEENTCRPKGEEPNNFCVIGLHTCGDLCINSLNLFLSTDSCKLCILLACCYHKMGKETVSNSKSESTNTPLSDSFRNFPLSSSLKESMSEFPWARSFLQIPFLRLAANETAHRWSCMSSEQRRTQLFHTLARAVIQLYLHRNHLTMKKTKRRCVTKMKSNDFSSYLSSFLSRCQILTESGEILEESPTMIMAITDLWENTRSQQKLVQILLCLQANIQFVAESLVVIDRVKYLLENKAKQVDIVRVLDDSVSPRALALCVFK